MERGLLDDVSLHAEAVAVTDGPPVGTELESVVERVFPLPLPEDVQPDEQVKSQEYE